jgi:transketolase
MRQRSLDCVYQLARQDSRVVFVGSDLGHGTLDQMKKEMPDRFYMEGVSEQAIVGLAAGLAMEGYIPYVNTIAPFFTRRAFEQVAVDLCLHQLPVRLIANGGGMVYAPLGPTHLAIEDIAALRSIPNMTIVAPCDAEEMSRFMPCTLDWPGPIYIRLGKGGDPVVSRPEDTFTIGKAIVRGTPGEVLIVTTGIGLNGALKAAGDLERDGIGCGIIHMHTLKPFDGRTVLEHLKGVRLLVTLEEHTLAGGLGSMVLETIADAGITSWPRVLRLGVPDVFPKEYGSQESMLDTFRLSATHVAAAVRSRMGELRH